MSIGNRIKQLRTDMNMSQVEFASAIGVSKQTLYKYENDLITNIPSDKIELAANICGVSPAYIMGWDIQDTSEITISSEEKILIDTFRALSPENKDKVFRYADGLLNSQEGDEVLRQIAAQREKQV